MVLARVFKGAPTFESCRALTNEFSILLGMKNKVQVKNLGKFEEYLFSENEAKVRAIKMKNRDYEPQEQYFCTKFLHMVDVQGG